jgi:putative nucleotidyltransferase with HDIG domain
MPRTKVKYFQDPLYGQIAVASPLLLALIDSRAVQRLRQIRQLGVSYLTFLGAEHSRFAHSLGAMTLMDRVLQHLDQEEGVRFSKANRELALAGALLHDIGHCAFSHTLEHTLGHNHEELGARLLREEPELKRILGPRAAALAALLQGTAKGREMTLIHSLLSSQLDVDRLDYLVRDAHSTGVNSGQVDLGRIIASFTVRKGRLMVKERGLLAVEEYFLARYFMYWKVYYHKTSRAMELLMKAAVGRAKALWREGKLPRESVSPALAAFLDRGPRVPVADFLDHDDSDVYVALKRWQHGPDPLLASLSSRFLLRKNLKMVWEAQTLDQDLSPRLRQRVREHFEKKLPGSAELFFIEDRLGSAPYDLSEPVFVAKEEGEEELSRRSRVVRDIAGKNLHARYYVPAEDVAAVAKILKAS